MKNEVYVRCEYFRNGLCANSNCGAAGRNRLGASSCVFDPTVGKLYYVYHCPENIYSRVSADGTKFMALVDDDEWPIEIKNPNLLFLNRKRNARKR